jgi:hypothetical protein
MALGACRVTFSQAPFQLAGLLGTWQSLGMRKCFLPLMTAFGLALAACQPPGANTMAAAAPPEPPSTCEDALAYRPVEGAVQWSAVSGSAITVSGDVILAPALAKFENFRPSGLRYLGRHEVGPLAAAFMNGRCAAIYALVADPARESPGDGLCLNGRAAFLAARIDQAGERLSLTIYSETADPQRGGEPCRALDFVKSV